VLLIERYDTAARATEVIGDAASIFEHESRIVIRPEPAVEARVEALRYPALAREKSVPDAGQPLQGFGNERRKHR
jgi:hypothetical protein